ncbi:methionine aminopeptidase, type I [Orientia chuto str. Dubai]|uniref:Methionine aminopeptidase n=1 Tax=Orientia chuto str. Dubai TaxID=1359168 RepID=A0A0F3MKU3_9RICK|nr:type I methionyl aminopeptidase [Candidatus Orientia mediorientalis]KJV56266.1 methionine aminopeptidase, type I [Orientia chuto str. Dubai]
MELAQQEFIKKMRIAGKIAASTLEMIEQHIQPGVTSNILNKICHDYIISHDAVPAPLGYKGFPKSICTSVNHVICHGIPNDKLLKNGDIINIDVSLSKDGAFADTCKMYFVGQPSVMAKRIVQCAQECLYYAINQVKDNASIRNIGRVIQKNARKYGYSVVRNFCGHGIGRMLHQNPQILHYDDASYENQYMKAGMTFTIEPMINVGKPDVTILPDGWTAITKDRSLSAQYEHTLLVLSDGVEILTLRNEEDLSHIKSFIKV